MVFTQRLLIDSVSWFCFHGQIFSHLWAFFCVFPSAWNALSSFVLGKLLLVPQNPERSCPMWSPRQPQVSSVTCAPFWGSAQIMQSFLLFLPLLATRPLASLGPRLPLSLPVRHLGPMFSHRCGEDPVLITITYHTEVKTVALFSLPSA